VGLTVHPLVVKTTTNPRYNRVMKVRNWEHDGDEDFNPGDLPDGPWEEVGHWWKSDSSAGDQGFDMALELQSKGYTEVFIVEAQDLDYDLTTVFAKSSHHPR
jgi:hypothetical protein